jgi:GDP-L-fucose synthase
MELNSKIFVAGHNGMVGSAILRKLKNDGYTNIITASHQELDLTNQARTYNFFKNEKPDYVFLAAAKVGGIVGNLTYPAEYIYSNLTIETNVINSCYKSDVKKLLFLGSSCIYPRECPQPIKEEYLLSGYLEKTNEPYAVAKIAGIRMCQAYNKQYNTNYISVMPTNLYGPKDSYHLENSHVFPAMIRKFHEAKIKKDFGIGLWGTGSPYREFLHVDDLADACVFLMNNYNDSEIINIGSGEDLTIRELAFLMKKVIGFEGYISFDDSKPDGTPRKLLDVSKLHSLGWKHTIELEEGIRETYKDYLSTLD